MTAYELRRHLTAAHGITTRGLPHPQLETLHADDHRLGGQAHTHTTPAGERR